LPAPEEGALASGLLRAQLRVAEIRARFGGRAATAAVGSVHKETWVLGRQRLGSSVLPYQALATRYERLYGLPAGLAAAVIEVESGGDPTAVSPKGAVGLMQLMPATARALGVAEAFDPEQNVRGGALYLRQMLDRFGSLPLALAAYNAGPSAVERYGAIPPFAETRRYVSRVLETMWRQGGARQGEAE